MPRTIHILDDLFHSLGHRGEVKFRIRGNVKDYNITYKWNDTPACHAEHTQKKWKHSFTAKPGDYVYFAAQSNEPHADIEVDILYNGHVFKSAHAVGDYAVAYAGGTLS